MKTNHPYLLMVLAQLQERLRRVRERFRSKGVPTRAIAEAASDEPLVPRAACCPQCGRVMELVRIWDARRGVIYERTLAPPVTGSAQAGDLREEMRGMAQRLFGFVENLVRKPSVSWA